jgi:hypothetical protein
MLSQAKFPHRHNRDGTYDSICTACFATIASVRDEELLPRRRIDGNPLTWQQPAIGQHAQHPTEHFPMRVQICDSPDK